MPSFTLKTILIAVTGAISITAYGYVSQINITGTVYKGYNAPTAPYYSTPKTLIAYSADIICHRGAKNAKGHAKVKAGNQIYINSAGCETIDKETLKFFKIDKVSLVKAGNPGTYGSDELIANDNG
ncbi:hypothetical protein NW760_014714 [Fusarium oxysporum]|nr:hypothetical protein NW769_015137 [Fusarium oxysporum]KAJ4214565.1 hypothetical protein NW760_014714 [Fusarium oxysporum]